MFNGAQMVKNLPAMWETQVQFLGREDPLEEGMATHSSILAWRIPMDRGAWWATVHAQRSLGGYRPWVFKELDMTERIISASSPLKVISPPKIKLKYIFWLGTIISNYKI